MDAAGTAFRSRLGEGSIRNMSSKRILGCDLDFLIGKSGSAVPRPAH